MRMSAQPCNDTVGQWKMPIMKPVQEINSNTFILNLQNGLYHTLDDSFKAYTPEYFSTVQLKSGLCAGCGLPAVFALSGKYVGRGGNLSHSGDHGLPAPAGKQGAKILCLCGSAQRGQKHPAQCSAGNFTRQRECVEYPVAKPERSFQPSRAV